MTREYLILKILEHRHNRLDVDFLNVQPIKYLVDILDHLNSKNHAKD